MTDADPRYIESGWLSYEAEVLPPDAGETQRVETRRAFFAGSWHVLRTLIQLGDDFPVDEAAEVLERIRREIEAFYRGGGV